MEFLQNEQFKKTSNLNVIYLLAFKNGIWYENIELNIELATDLKLK